MKILFNLILILSLTFTFGCTRHIKTEKFDINPAEIMDFKSDTPIKVLVPENAEKEYLVEFTKPERTHANVYVDLNEMYKNAKELIEEEIVGHHVPLSPDAEKYLKFTITKVQWEIWAGGFSIGSYLEFDIETGDGYKSHYKVQDGSGMDVSRAVGGTISRAVEKIFQDEAVLSYIEKTAPKISTK
jgi:hypothetical protein